MSAPRTHRSNSSVQPTEVSVQRREGSVQFFQYKTTEFLFDLNECPSERRFSETNYAQRLRDKWNEAKGRGVINYDLNSMYKLLDGDYNLSMQLNVERGTLRRKPMRFQSIVQPFNPHRWNFTKLRPEEVMYYARCLDKPITDDPLDTHTICVNASPLERAHSLIVPSISKCLPQIMNESGIRLATDLMLLVEDENFHVLYNSLLGQASVNHLHMHALFWPYESDLIYRRYEHLAGSCYIARRPVWFIGTFIYQLRCSDEFDSFVKIVWRTLNFLTKRNVAHNVFFTRAAPIRTDGPLRDEDTSGKPSLVTVFIIPRQCHTGAKPMNNFNPAALELSGCLTAYTYRFFESATEQSALRTFDEDAVMDDGEFEILCGELSERLEERVQWAAPVAVPSLRERHHAPYIHVESADSTTTEYDVCELEELKDNFRTIQSPSSYPIHPHPLRHHHSFHLGSTAAPSAHLRSPGPHRRSHTSDGSTTFTAEDEAKST